MQHRATSNDIASITATIARLMAHYWTANESATVRREQTDDWIEDLAEFPATVVVAACREWRQTQSRRPTPAEIRLLCIAERQAQRKHQLAIADYRQPWPQWLAELWGPAPDGPRLRAEATKRIKRTLGEAAE